MLHLMTITLRHAGSFYKDIQGTFACKIYVYLATYCKLSIMNILQKNLNFLKQVLQNILG
jgi:hypothetical protein